MKSGLRDSAEHASCTFYLLLQPDVLLNYSGHGLRRLLPRRPALALAVAVKLSSLVNGLFTLPAYLYPYQVGGWRVAFCDMLVPHLVVVPPPPPLLLLLPQLPPVPSVVPALLLPSVQTQ